MTTQPFSESGLARIDALLTDAVHAKQVPGVVVGLGCGDAVHVSHAGEATLGATPMRADTLFRIASLTKPVTAAVVLAMVEEGLLRLDEAVDRLLPELADRRVLRTPDGPLDDTVPAPRAITVRDLLTFTFGFGMQGAIFTARQPWPIMVAQQERGLETLGPPKPGRMLDPDTWLARFGELPLMCAPGETWLYNTASQVLSVLAARAGGAPFDVVMRDRLLAPLGMSDTVFSTTDTAQLATAYACANGAFVVVDGPDGEWSHPSLFPDGSAGLLSTAADVVRFGRMLIRGGLGVLSAETVAEMTRDQLTAAQRDYTWTGFNMLSGRGWGYGVSVLADGSYGWDGGFGTTWTNVPELDLTVVVLTQRQFDETGPPAVCDQILQAAKAAAR